MPQALCSSVVILCHIISEMSQLSVCSSNLYKAPQIKYTQLLNSNWARIYTVGMSAKRTMLDASGTAEDRHRDTMIGLNEQLEIQSEGQANIVMVGRQPGGTLW